MQKVIPKFIFFLALLLVVSVSTPVQYVRADTFGDYTYTNNGNGTATITDYTGTDQEVIIPGTLNGLTVVGFGIDAFRNKALTSVTIPNSVRTIGPQAFLDNKLTSVTIPGSVTTIELNAFRNNDLTTVIISDGVTTIGDAAFYQNNITSVGIPDSVTTIGAAAFTDNDLINVDISDGVTTIGTSAFSLNNLSSVTIPGSVTSIGSDAFRDNSLTSVTISDGVATIGASAFYNNSITSIIIPDSVTTVGNSAFMVNSLTSVTLPDSSLITIGAAAFQANQLTSITIPESIPEIGEYAFYGNQLTSVIINGSDTIIRANAFAENQSISANLTFYGHDSSTAKNYAAGNEHTFYAFTDLTGLTLSAGSLDPVFASGTEDYTADVANSVNAIEVTPTTAVGTSTVTVNGHTVVSGSASDPIALSVGANTITVVVTAQDGSTKTYTVEVTRAASSNADLTGLTLSAGSLDPVFAAGTEDYTADVANSVSAIEVTPTTAVGTSTVTVNGNTVVSGSASDPIALSVGANTITVVVTAQDGSTKTYTVEVTRAASSNANLSGLTLSAGSLDPLFASGTEDYTAAVANSLNAIEVTPTTAVGSSTVTVNGNTVVSGSASDPITLNVGANTITVVVTAQDGSTKTYTVKVTRAPYVSPEDDSDDDNDDPTPVETKYVMTLTTEEHSSDSYTFSFKQGDLLPDVIELDGGNLKPGQPLDAWILAIPAQTMRALVAYNPEGTVRLLTPVIAYDLPVSLLSGINRVGVTEVTLRIRHVDQTILREMEQAAAAIGARLAAVPVETELAVTNAVGKRVVQRYAQYISRTLAVKNAGDPDQQTGVRYNPSERTFQFLPSRFEDDEATLQSRSGGIETVLVHSKTFLDAEGAWSEEVTNRLGSKLIVYGKDETHFVPDAPVTRAEMAAMLVRSLGLQEDKDELADFSDVSPASWYSSVLAAAAREGLVQGDGTGEFRPEEHISREEAVVMIVSAMRYANIQSKPDADADLSLYHDNDLISSWAKNEMAKAVEAGLIFGNGENQLMPQKSTSRAEAAAMIDRLLRTIGFID